MKTLFEQLSERKAANDPIRPNLMGKEETAENLRHMSSMILHYSEMGYLFIQYGNLTVYKDGKLVLSQLPHWDYTNTTREYNEANTTVLMKAFSTENPKIKIQQNGPTLLITW